MMAHIAFQLEELSIELTQKRMRSVRIGVYPNGSIRVSAPLSYSTEKIRQALLPRLEWMRLQRSKFLKTYNVHTDRLKAGSHLYSLGKLYPIETVTTTLKPWVERTETSILIHTKNELSSLDRNRLLRKWQERELREKVEFYLRFWANRFQVTVNEYQIRKMKSKWGSCHIEAKKIVLNLELVKHPPECIEYVCAHEVIHLLEASHNTRFKAFMTQAIPNWKILKEQLKVIPMID